MFKFKQACSLSLSLSLLVASLFPAIAFAQGIPVAQPIAASAKMDFDGDGTADAVSVDIVFGHEGRARGAVRIQTPTGAPVAILYGPETNDLFGESVLGLGNIDGVPGDEIAVSAPLAHDNGARSGRVYIFSVGQTDPILVLESASCDGVFGTGLALTPDVDGDGHSDIMVLVDPAYEYPEDSGYDLLLEWHLCSTATGAVLDSGTVDELPTTTSWNDRWTYHFGLSADLDVDGQVTQADVNFVLARLGTIAPDAYTHIPGDLNGDMQIDAADVLLVSADLGTSATWVKSLPWKKIIGKAKGVGKTVGFFALIRAGACIAAIDAIVITCELSIDTSRRIWYYACA